MPTPFYHLQIAEDLFNHPELLTPVRSIIAENFPAFLLGHIAPDVQSVSGQSRECTHFYSMPLDLDAALPWRRIQEIYPSLVVQALDNPEHRVFIVGYCCHLQADWFWTARLFEPYFGPEANWKSFRDRLYLHNVLRSYLDLYVSGNINGEIRTQLEQSSPSSWLPFVTDTELENWRDYLTGQLKPGAAIQTVDIFAARQGISVEAYYDLLNSEIEMRRKIFDFLPEGCLHEYRESLLNTNLILLNEYLA